MGTAMKQHKKKTTRRSGKSDKAVMSTIVTVRISEREKERISKIMMDLGLTRYSDMMRIALHMIGPNNKYTQVDML
jgi:hypothetical protein